MISDSDGNRMHMLSRRQLTIGASASILLAPFIAMLKENSTRAATGKQAKRLLVFCTMGTKPDSWTPTVSGEAISAWSAMTQPLSAIKESVLLVEGCPAGNPEEGHGSPQALTGQGYGYYAVNNVPQPKVSVDQFVSAMLVKAGVKRHWWKPLDEELTTIAGNGSSRKKTPLSGAKAGDTGEGTRYGRRPKRPEKAHAKAGRKPQQ